MPLTREFKDTVMELAREPEFRIELLKEALESYLIEADVPTGNLLLRDYLNATVAFKPVAEELGIKVASLRRMLSETGNARSQNIFNVIHVCLRREGLNSLESLIAA